MNTYIYMFEYSYISLYVNLQIYRSIFSKRVGEKVSLDVVISSTI